MTLTYLFKRHQATMRSAGTPEAVAERKVHSEASKRALDDTRAAYPKLTSENFEAADAYRMNRLEHWKRELS